MSKVSTKHMQQERKHTTTCLYISINGPLHPLLTPDTKLWQKIKTKNNNNTTMVHAAQNLKYLFERPSLIPWTHYHALL